MDSGAGNTRIRPCATSTSSTEYFIFNHFMHPIILLSPPVLFMHGIYKVLAMRLLFPGSHIGIADGIAFCTPSYEGMVYPSHFLLMGDVCVLVKFNGPCLLFRITLRVQTSELMAFHDKNNYRG